MIIDQLFTQPVFEDAAGTIDYTKPGPMTKSSMGHDLEYGIPVNTKGAFINPMRLPNYEQLPDDEFNAILTAYKTWLRDYLTRWPSAKMKPDGSMGRASQGLAPMSPFPSIQEAADPSRLIVTVTILPMSAEDDTEVKEFDLTGRFQGDARSQINQATAYLKKFLESRGINFTLFQATYQGQIVNQQNYGSMEPQNDAERELQTMANQIRNKHPGQNATPALKEFAPSDDGEGPDQEEILRRLAAHWWNGNEHQMARVEHTLAAMGWEIGEDDGYDEGGVFVVRPGDEHGRSYLSWPHEELDMNESGLQKFSHKKNRFRSLHKLQNPLGEENDPKRAKLERMIWKYFGQIYDYGDDDGLNYLDEQGELWNQLMDKYDGEIEDIVAQEPIEVLMQAAQELKGIAGDMKYELDEAAQGHTIEAHGVRGMDRRTWHKTFKNTDQMMAWAEKHDAEIVGTRDLEQARHHNLSPARQDMAEGVAETVSMDQAKKVLRHYGADHFKTTTNELHFYKNGRPMSVDLIFNDDATRSVNLSQLNSATRRLKGHGVAKGQQIDEMFADQGSGSTDRDNADYMKRRNAAKKAGYTGRETKAGTWRVFKDGNAVAAAGPFKSADEAAAWIKKHKQGITEMDKSQPSAGRDTGPRSGPDKEAKPITAKKATKDAADMLNRAFRDSHKKKDVKESDSLMMKLRRALIKEGRVKELALDLKTMSDADFMKKYGKAKAAIRKDMKRVDEAETVSPNDPMFFKIRGYTPEEIADIQSGKKTRQQVDAERNKKAMEKAAKDWQDAERDATRVDSQGRRIDKNGNLLPPPKAEPIPNAPLNPPPGYYKIQNFEGLNEQDAAGQQFVGTGTSSNWQMSVDIAARNARIKAAQSIAGANNIPNGVQLPAGTKYGPQDTKSDGTGKYVSTYTITLPAPGQSAEPPPAAPGAALDSLPATSNMNGSMSTGAPAAVGPAAGNYMKVNELSTNKLSQYKTAAAKDAKKADQAGDFKRGDKRLGGMVQATRKQFDNDAKKVDESRAARRALMAKIVNSK